MILYGFMVRYGENNRGGGLVVFRQNERPWLLGLSSNPAVCGISSIGRQKGFEGYSNLFLEKKKQGHL